MPPHQIARARDYFDKSEDGISKLNPAARMCVHTPGARPSCLHTPAALRISQSRLHARALGLSCRCPRRDASFSGAQPVHSRMLRVRSERGHSQMC